jgi:MFS family permease
VLSSLGTNAVAGQRAVFLLDTLHLPVALFSVPVLAATLLGAAGSLLAPKLLAGRLTARRLLLICLPGSAISAAVLPAAGGPLWLILLMVMAATALPLFFGTAANLAVVSVLSDDIGDEFFGRVTTLLASVVTLASTLGALLGGVLGETFGVRTGIWLCQAFGFAAVAVFLVRARRGASHPPGPPTDPPAGDAPDDPANPDEPALVLGARS